MTRRQTQNILENFDCKAMLYNLWTRKLELLIREILESKQLPVHSVTGRTKGRTSLEKKIESKSRRHYTNLEDVTDLSGIRVITYFADDVDRVAEAIKQEFEIDLTTSVDKRNQLDAEAFGYLSVHYIISLNGNRAHLPEYSRLLNLKAEIQIRSVLQHAWAEIEHDLGYKTEGEIPRTLRRRFSRLAGLLELGDDEFIHIRDQLNEYEINVSQNITKSPQSFEIDKLSLKSFIESGLCAEFDQEISKATGLDICPINIDGNQDGAAMSAEWNLLDVNYIGIRTIGELEARLKKFRPLLGPFAAQWIALHRKPAQIDDDIDATPSSNDIQGKSTFPPGICLLYLALVYLASTGDHKEIQKYWVAIKHRSPEDAEVTATLLEKTYSECSQNISID